jgi:hypothetical protein
MIDPKLNQSLNFKQVQSIINDLTGNRNVDLLLAPNIHNLQPDDIFKNSDYILVNYLSRPNYGHWVCLYFNRKNNIINFFDSYGGMPDDQLKYIPTNFRIASNQYYPNLLQLLYDLSNETNGPTIEYNFIALQNNESTTCGRWCALYLSVCDVLTIDQFSSIIKKIADMVNISTDELVCKLT